MLLYNMPSHHVLVGFETQIQIAGLKYRRQHYARNVFGKIIGKHLVGILLIITLVSTPKFSA